MKGWYVAAGIGKVKEQSQRVTISQIESVKV